MNHADFEIAIWHPFGTHGRERADDIIKRKCDEIVKNGGWTLWSFQYRTPDTFARWKAEFSSTKAKSVLVFCSEGRGAKDPKGEPHYCKSFQFAGESTWQLIPDGIKVPHPFPRGKKLAKLASAFVVRNIIYPVEVLAQPLYVECFSLKKGWGPGFNGKIWTRPEFLIRLGGKDTMLPYRAILELHYPNYFATVSLDGSCETKA